jgi:ribosomal protein S18 acetylase RimI-like enzyme
MTPSPAPTAAPYHVDDAAPADRAAVLALFVEDLQGLRAPVGSPEALGAVFDGLLAAEGVTILVARTAAGEAVGVLVASALLSVKFAGRSLWIEELYVSRAHRRHGLGAALVQALLERARAAGVLGIDLEAYQGNTPAAVLYRRLGFRRLGRERFHYWLAWDEEGGEA